MRTSFSQLTHYPVIRFFVSVCLLVLACSTSKSAAETINLSNENRRFEVKSLDIEGFSTLDRLDISGQTLADLIRQKRAQYDAQMSVAELHQIADEMTVWVRKKGYSFHTVYLPPQKITDGKVKLILQEGRLSGINVINKTGWSDRNFSRPFKRLVGKLLYAPAIEKTLFDLKAQAGIKVFAFFSRGKNSGEAILNLRVEATRKRALMGRLDNYGSKAIGEHRLIVQYSEYQVTGHYDRLSFALLQTLDGGGSTYGSISYRKTFMPLNWDMDMSYSNNQFSLGDVYESLDYQGDLATFRGGLTRYFNQKQGQVKSVRLGYYSLESDVSSLLDNAITGALADDESSQAVTLDLLYQGQVSAIQYNITAGFAKGQYTKQGSISEPILDRDFSKYMFGVTASMLLSPEKRFGSRLMWRFRAQYSDEILPGIERSATTGASVNRAFESGFLSADRRYLSTVEWLFPNVYRRPGDGKFSFSPFIFYDWTWGERHEFDGPSDNTGNLLFNNNFSSVGAGIDFNINRRVSSRLSVASPVSAGVIENADNGIKVLFELSFR